MSTPATPIRSLVLSSCRHFRPLAGSVAALLFGAALALPGAVSAATITWTAPTNVLGDSDVDTQGTLVGAYVFGDVADSGFPAVTNAVVNGVTFTAEAIPFVSQLNSFTFGNFSITTTDVFRSSTQDGGTVAPFTGLSAGYQELLSCSVATNNNTTSTLTLGGLTMGATYQFEWWVSVSDSGDNGTPFPTTGTAGNAVTLSGNTTGMPGGIGQFSIGTFVATGTSQSIVFSGPDLPGLNGFELRQTGVAALPATYWRGGTDGTWTGSNWASNAIGTATTAIPTSADTSPSRPTARSIKTPRWVRISPSTA